MWTLAAFTDDITNVDAVIVALETLNGFQGIEYFVQEVTPNGNERHV